VRFFGLVEVRGHQTQQQPASIELHGSARVFRHAVCGISRALLVCLLAFLVSALCILPCARSASPCKMLLCCLLTVLTSPIALSAELPAVCHAGRCMRPGHLHALPASAERPRASVSVPDPQLVCPQQPPLCARADPVPFSTPAV
jgi:hypothetical protein